ncbi:uncharacterized protein LOC125760669 isoform X1 [Anopheles funestus]|uniref:uncharacterized protein LOC125760669 isoform X1 n=1 Tax=Anopheles funestus TaxID=62324 RepID=UPI0020C5DEBA|nr:uncharacterized protein LOC125760669 isoform X1 [Anopheles funestus]
MATSPGSDNNCNIYMPPLGCSVASSHDFSDYQWFTDFGSYRDGVTTHQSILSALSASYNGIGELSYYEKMAKDIDANLAEIDMESFRKEDINSLLTAIPSQLRLDDAERKARNNNRIFSTITSCTAAGLIPADMMDNSFCKSELLFSPVKESHISVDSLDMDGYPDEEDIILTCQANKDNYTIAFEQSILYSEESYYDGPEHYGKYKRMNLLNNLQNRAQYIRHKDSMSRSEVNYTTWSNLKRTGTLQRPPIAVNPLITHISRHNRTCFVRKSFSMPNLQSDQPCSSPAHLPSKDQHQLNVSQAGNGHNSEESFERPMRTLLPMYTLPTDSENESSTNGNGVDENDQCDENNHLPNEHRESRQQQPEDQQHPQLQHQAQQQTLQQPSFNLVKLFIKQKSSSTDTCMDVSSGCWPSDSTNSGGSGDHQMHHLGAGATIPAMRCRKKSMHDSGKCSTTGGGSVGGGRHGEEEEFQLDSLDAQINNSHVNTNNNNGSHSDVDEEGLNGERGGPPSSPQRAQGTNGAQGVGNMKLNDFNRQMHGSPRRQYKGFNMNIGGGRRLLHELLQQHNGCSIGSASALNSSSSINNNNNHNLNNNNSYKDTNSDTSRTSENLTQIFNHSGNNNTTLSSGCKTKIPIDMITKSMQTSLIGTPTTNGGNVAREKVRVIPPSFLDRLNELGDKQKAPVFVVYPNYALPDLGFLKTQNEVVISPLTFKETMTGAGRPLKKPRPVSMNDIENIRQREYKHVTDWKSLVFLLPTEYRKLLRHIPEVSELSLSTEKQPMFCMTPPLRRGVARGVSCDCTNLLNQNTQTYNSSSSGGSSSAAPSSGYRGSSTMLTTDSEMDGILGPSNSSNIFNNNLYVYQYDSPAEVLVPCERPPSGRTVGGTPKSILRRPQGTPRGVSNPASSAANNHSNMKAKRSSMFEEQQMPHYPQASREKRRSLQEHHSYNFYEDAEEEEEHCAAEPKLHNSPNMTPHPRLANTPKLPSADHYHKLNKLVEFGDNDTATVGDANHQQCIDDDLDARARAEQFLSHVPKSELKHYAEIAHILESTEMIESSEPAYDRTRLRNEVSRLLSQKRNVTFTKQQTVPSVSNANSTTPVRQQPSPATVLLRPTEIKFSTPPNSPNMSVTVAKTGHHHNATGMATEKKPPVAQRTPSSLAGSPASGTEKEKQDKIQTNRFKRLQIQWELLSKEASVKASTDGQRKEIRSGGNTPTGGNSGSKSRIPRPVSYPTTRTNSDPVVSKTLKSPSRIVAPKKYGAIQSPVTTPPTPAPRTPSKTFSNTTPKKVSSAPSRPATRTRIPLGNRSKKFPAK